jgi:SAM-dependent methyltransferase
MGCGNGRFYEFLTKSLSTLQVQYTGIDNSAALLDQAQKKYTNDHSLFIESDIISPLHSSSSSSIPTEPVSDLVVAFGFLHHIPSIQARQNFLSLLTSLIHENGIIVVTAWQFTAIPALMKRVTKPQLLALSPEQFEDGDYILDWQRGKNGYRYCHLTTQTEIEVLCSQAGLQIEAQFTADGKSHNLNHYYVLKKSSSEKRKS